MSTDDVLRLQQPLKEGGIRTVNFFNGRLLTGRDLSREQEAWRLSDARLGLALGSGVATGLEVEKDDFAPGSSGPVVRVKAGLAVNRQGHALRLTRDTSVAITRPFDAVAGDCLFKPCGQLRGGTYVEGAGVHILTIAPSGTSEGRAPTNGLDPANVRCSTDANVDALQFRLVTVDVTQLAGLDLASPGFRNELAYRCFGAGVHADWFASLFTRTSRVDDLLDAVAKVTLSDLEVPIALLYMVGAAQIAFVDTWAVRRPLHAAESSAFAGLVQPRRLAVGHAMFLQFQSHIADLTTPVGGVGAITARSHFRYLPPVGVIPVDEETAGSDDRATAFFTGMTCRGPAFINGARVEALVRESLSYPPIDSHGAEVVWLYRVRENRMAIELGTASPAPRSYVVYSSGHLPYRADGQFDLGHWNYSNFALR